MALTQPLRCTWFATALLLAASGRQAFAVEELIRIKNQSDVQWTLKTSTNYLTSVWRGDKPVAKRAAGGGTPSDYWDLAPGQEYTLKWNHNLRFQDWKVQVALGGANKIYKHIDIAHWPTLTTPAGSYHLTHAGYNSPGPKTTTDAAKDDVITLPSDISREGPYMVIIINKAQYPEASR